MSDPSETVRVAVVGLGWMGGVHARAYGRVRHHYPHGPGAVLAAVADDVPGRAKEAAAQYGAQRFSTDWRAVVAEPEIDAVSVTVPNFLHREIGCAVLQAGKHLWIEKPVGLSAADAQAVRDAAVAADRRTAVGFNYRNAPAVEAARDLIARGDIGAPILAEQSGEFGIQQGGQGGAHGQVPRVMACVCHESLSTAWRLRTGVATPSAVRTAAWPFHAH